MVVPAYANGDQIHRQEEPRERRRPATIARRIVVVAASAGGVGALQVLLSRLPADFPAPILVVLHIPATGGRALPRILDRAGPLLAAAAADGEDLQPGRVYVAPPDRHVLVVGDTVRVCAGPRQKGHRPAADPLFGSVALAVAPRAVAVVLSGALDDGAAGCAAVERRGGLVVVQDPQESHYNGMPRAAIALTQRAVVLTVARIADFLDERTRTEAPATPLTSDRDLERYISLLLRPTRGGEPEGGLSCPECGGQLGRVAMRHASIRYECELGHVFSPGNLAVRQSAAIERLLWAATFR